MRCAFLEKIGIPCLESVILNVGHCQNWAFFNWKRWREQLSSPKLGISELKTVTRTALVAKFGRFSTKNGDEISSRRQNWAFLN